MINEDEFKRAKYFYDSKTIVHISKYNKEFLNGQIIEIGNDFIVIQDKFKGRQFVFFKELAKPIEEFTRKI